MGACNNCFNGCVNITSDQCIKYTGQDISSLGIESGDSLSVVQTAITDFLVTVLDGTGILPTIDEEVICTEVSDALGEYEDLTLSNVINALITVICDIEDQLTANTDDLEELNASYTTDCLDGTPEGTHSVLQAVIDKICEVDDGLATLIDSTLPSEYVALVDLTDLIDDRIGAIGSTLYCNRMVPYTAVEYWSSDLSQFNNGVGTGDWINIYLCNGQNGTPDKRGRVTVSVTNVPGGTPYLSTIDPATSTNPNYTLGLSWGSNIETLTITQIPSHTHLATTTVIMPSHTHFTVGESGSTQALSNSTPINIIKSSGDETNYILQGINSAATLGKTSASGGGYATSSETGISYTGGNAAHSNIQPSIACYYIMYIPNV